MKGCGVVASEFLSLVGERIRTIRKEKNYTQEFLAEKANIHYTYISDIERGERNISLETLEKVVQALEISPVEVFLFEERGGLAERNDKKALISALDTLLSSRKLEEVELIVKMARDITATYDSLSKE
ncbi:helix-turn-helix transcriptional regulator [Paenibacillus spiritus]|uniref:Helix-turn-helix transcriptional regulator n=1 Tax=Paenibacillus spiritus TaxID=2496557 RepID=A0A5J5FSX3_9BACL|nr:helix-turn-helix transcriptional regulator [Paenibacillus spiritus]